MSAAGLGLHRVDNGRELQILHHLHGPVREMRDFNGFFVQHFKASMTLVSFDHLQQRPDFVLVPLQNLTKVSPVERQGPGYAEFFVFDSRVRNDVFDVRSFHIRARSTKVEYSDHTFSFGLSIL